MKILNCSWKFGNIFNIFRRLMTKHDSSFDDWHATIQSTRVEHDILNFLNITSCPDISDTTVRVLLQHRNGANWFWTLGYLLYITYIQGIRCQVGWNLISRRFFVINFIPFRLSAFYFIFLDFWFWNVFSKKKEFFLLLLFNSIYICDRQQCVNWLFLFQIVLWKLLS